MTITKRLSAIALTLIMLVSFIPMTVFAAGKSGWEQSGDYWYYYQNDQMLKKTWLYWQKNWYYFNADGQMISNMNYYDEVSKKVYFFEKSGALTKKTGWVSHKYESSYKAWSYLKKGGICKTGWKKIGGKWYYFNYQGYMNELPTTSVDGIVYAFNNNGTLVTKTGWVRIKYYEKTYWFYVKKGGICTIGWKKVGGKWYYFQNYGPMLSDGTYNIGGKDYVFDKNGVCLNP